MRQGLSPDVTVHTCDLTHASRHLLEPMCAECTWWQSPAPGAAVDREAWELAVIDRCGLFGTVLLDDRRALGWVHAAPSQLTPRAWRLPAGPPSPDASVLTCAFLYDDEYLPAFHHLLQGLQASLKTVGVAAIEAFALRRVSLDDRFRGYLRERNLFNHEVLEGSGFRPLRGCGDVVLYRLDLATLVAAPRWSTLAERLEKHTAPLPV